MLDYYCFSFTLQFDKEDDAKACVEGLRDRYYNGILLQPSLSPVTDFREARCRQHEDNSCGRSGYCNFMHIRPLPRWLNRELEAVSRETRRQASSSDSRDRSYGFADRGRDRERDRDRRSSRGHRHRSYSRSRSRSRSSSTERRETIAKWNQERDSKN